MSANSKGWVYDSIFVERLGLTRRETEVLTWVADGKTNAEIGVILGTSPRTVQKHLEHIFEKLGVETRTAAAVRALALTSSREPQLVPLPHIAA
jgi:DNA-binding CsgD family transcriptional regulator